MSLLRSAIDLFLHLDVHLQSVITHYGALTYALLFLIVFCETGLVILPFLPGDSLLFAAGTFAARGALHPIALFVLLSAAAIVGDAVNYLLGAAVGKRAFRPGARFLNHHHLAKTQAFYDKYGNKAIVLARFVPIIRTLAPFVAGIGQMPYSRFAVYNVVGGTAWVGLFVFAGYFFGTIPFVADHFELVILAIIALSLVPPIVEYVRGKKKAVAGS